MNAQPPNIAAPPSRHSNPFATCWTRPGALPYLSCEHADPERVATALDASGWRGLVIGPHGAGKSTLLAALEPLASVRGYSTEWTVVRPDRACRLPRPRSGAVLFVEGLERLPRWRQRLTLAMAPRGVGIVATLHSSAWALWGAMPVVANVVPCAAICDALFRMLTAGHTTPVTVGDARRAFERNAGDLRRVWFDLYNQHEATRANPAGIDGVSRRSVPAGKIVVCEH